MFLCGYNNKGELPFQNRQTESTMKRCAYLAVVAFSLLCSCSSDFYYANSFIRKFDVGKESATEQIYVSLPKAVIHTNSSLNDITGFMFMTEREQDSVIASKTAILDKLDDSIFLDQFNTAFLFTLSRLKVPIIVVDDEAMLPKPDDNHFTIAIVQVEAEEYLQPGHSQFTTRRGVHYSYDYDLRHFVTHVWLKIDARDSIDVVYYKNDEEAETFSGVVTSLKEDKATMTTKTDRISVNDAYRVARRLGSHCATLYVEKLLTEYVCRSKGTNESYFYYDAGSNMIEAILPYDEGIKDSFEKINPN